jgi:hypothetical protein
MRLTAIANQTSRDPVLAKHDLNLAYLNTITKLSRDSKATTCYTAIDFYAVKKLLDHGWLQLEDGIDYNAMDLKWNRGLEMPLS